MSKRHIVDWRVADEYGEYRKTVKVVYYSDRVLCPHCKGTGKRPYDNRVPVDFSAHCYGPATPEPWEEDCPFCGGDKEIEKIDYKAMTPKQIVVYREYTAYYRERTERYNDHLLTERAGGRAEMGWRDVQAMY